MDGWVNGWPHVKWLKSNKSWPNQDNSIMDILDIFWTFSLNHLSPLWGYFFYYLPPVSAMVMVPLGRGTSLLSIWTTGLWTTWFRALRTFLSNGQPVSLGFWVSEISLAALLSDWNPTCLVWRNYTLFRIENFQCAAAKTTKKQARQSHDRV